MRVVTYIGILLMGLVLATPRSAAAQQPTPPQGGVIERLAARLDTLEAGACPAGPALTPPIGSDSQSVALAAIIRRLEAFVARRCGAAAPAVEDDLAAIRAAAAAAGDTPGDRAVRDSAQGGPTPFVGRQRNASALNPEISATGDIRLVGERHAGLEGDAHEFEVALQSTLDPYSTAKLFLTFSREEIGVEEGYIYWTGLPGRIRADLGQMRQQVGDLNRWHLHALPESEYPLVYQRYLGEDGLGGAGVSLYASLPVSLLHGTHEVWLQGTTAASDALYGPGRHGTLLVRAQNFWQLTRSTYGQLGFTALGGNTDSLRSRVLGLDLRLTWRPPHAGTRQNVTFRAEGYRFRGHELGTATTRYGGFLDLTCQASRRWTLGARYDWVETPRGARTTVWQVSPTLTWWQSEFVYLRLEGQHQHDSVLGDRDRLLLQAVFSMGPHKHETY